MGSSRLWRSCLPPLPVYYRLLNSKKMGLLRSETMKYGVLVLPVQDARKYLDHIGKQTSIQFEDMNAHEMRRPYNKHVQRINEMERMLRFMFEEVSKMEGCTIT